MLFRSVVYNKGASTVIIADNSITGMTGHQHNPSTGRTLKDEQTYAVDIPTLCKAVGVTNVVTVDANNMKEVERVVKEEMAKDEPSVIITKAPCKLIIKEKWDGYSVDENCVNCGACLKLGCPAICKETSKVSINAALCAGCGLCASACPKKAINREVK